MFRNRQSSPNLLVSQVQLPSLSTANRFWSVGRSPLWQWSVICLSGLGLLSSSLMVVQAAIAQDRSPVPSPPSADATPAAPPIRAVPDLPQLMPEFSTPITPPAASATAPAVSAPLPAKTSTAAPTAAGAALADPESPAVVLTERSTGCQAMFAAGQAISGPCAPVLPMMANGSPTNGRSGNGGRDYPVSAISAPYVYSGVGRGDIGRDDTVALRNFYNRRLRPPGRWGNGSGQLMFPLAIPAAISSAFGWRVHPLTGDQRFHSGTDLAAPVGTPVLAAYAGQVAIADVLGGYGITVALDHQKGTQQTLYAHLSELFVKPGEQVKQGDVIGLSGNTGNSTGPHLHFEVRQLTSEGWIAMDAGEQLEVALAQLVQALTVAQKPQKPQALSVDIGLKGTANSVQANAVKPQSVPGHHPS